jgi:bifunctional UDP-N-acetylglucosamine pyrophosphorylase/glucosamine-1-phosphate N-acetyltransferase
MPLFQDHQIEDFLIGNKRISDHHRDLRRDGIHFHPHAWLTASDLEALSSNGNRTLIDQRETPLAWLGDFPSKENTLAAVDSFLIIQTWDLLRANELYVGSLPQDFDELAKRREEGAIHALAVVEGYAQIGEGTRLLPGVYIEGNVVIGSNCKIGPNCYIRGNTSIGDHCHIGQSVEIKNSIILSNTNVGHLSYVGDSVLGANVNFGAGTNTSNLRHDGTTHRTMVDGVLVDTGRRKLGAIVGDGVHTGINTSIYPGRKLFPNTSTRPGEIVRHDLHGS